MSVSDADIAFAKELFAGLPDITTRKMMGGLCLYSEGVIFAIIHPEGQICIKAQGGFIQEIESLGGERWSYSRPDKPPVQMPYWSLPDAYLDDPEAAQELARKAISSLL
jgi:DNA transformation protein